MQETLSTISLKLSSFWTIDKAFPFQLFKGGKTKCVNTIVGLT
nr:MAG TPA: hypothetical protein [Caudoviricetes sp.]